MAANNNEVDLRTFLIKFIVFHLKQFKIFLIGLLLLVVGIIAIWAFIPSSYQAKVLIRVGTVPIEMLKNENLSFFSENNFIEENQHPISFIQNVDTSFRGYFVLNLKIENDTSGLNKFLEKYITFLNQSNIINGYILSEKQRLNSELSELNGYLNLVTNQSSIGMMNYPIDKLISSKSKINQALYSLKRISFVKIITISNSITRKLIIIILYFMGIVILTYLWSFITTYKEEILKELNEK